MPIKVISSKSRRGFCQSFDILGALPLTLLTYQSLTHVCLVVQPSRLLIDHSYSETTHNQWRIQGGAHAFSLNVDHTIMRVRIAIHGVHNVYQYGKYIHDAPETTSGGSKFYTVLFLYSFQLIFKN